MGSLRLLLALSVVAAHSKGLFLGWSGVYGQLAVESFYIVSGFLITVILHQKYPTSDGNWIFYSNRFLRIWVPYIAVAAATLLILKASSKFGGHVLGGSAAFSKSAFQNFDPLTLVAVLGTNLLLFGQDLAMWLAYNPETGLYLTPNFRQEQSPFNQFYILDQSWTLGLELTFYLVAPYVVRRHWTVIVVLMSASLGARALAYNAGYDFDPWTYRFFPFELALFLAGALSARVYLNSRLVSEPPGHFGGVLALSAIGLVALWCYLPGTVRPNWLLYAVVSGTLPVLFALTKDWSFDQFLGSLSYPVYLVHVPIILILRSWGLDDNGGIPSVILMPASLLLATLLAYYVETPLDRLRQSRVSRPNNPALRTAEESSRT